MQRTILAAVWLCVMNAAYAGTASEVTQNFCNSVISLNFNLAKVFLQQGADINSRDCVNDRGKRINTTLLQSFIIETNGTEAMDNHRQRLSQQIQFLLDNGATVKYVFPKPFPDSKDPLEGTTTLMSAIENFPVPFAAPGNTDMPNGQAFLQQFLADGGKVDAQDSNGNTALIYAAARGYGDGLGMIYVHWLIDLLIKNGADVNHQNKNGDNALILSSKVCAPQDVKFFLGRGANPKLKTIAGKTAFDLALDKAAKTNSDNCNETVAILQSPDQYANAKDFPTAPPPETVSSAASTEDSPPTLTGKLFKLLKK